MELLEYSMGFLCAMIYNKLICTSKGERPPPYCSVLLATRQASHQRHSPNIWVPLPKRAIPSSTSETPFAQSRPLIPINLVLTGRISKRADY